MGKSKTGKGVDPGQGCFTELTTAERNWDVVLPGLQTGSRLKQPHEVHVVEIFLLGLIP